MNEMTLDEHILRIVSKQRIENQQQLVDALQSIGVDANQSTLSRRLRRLNIRKRDGYYQFAHRGDTGLGEAFKRLAVGVEAVPPNIVLIRTLPGHAGAVSYHFEKLGVPGVVGTVAGDDTILVAVRPPDQLDQVALFIKNFFRFPG